MGYYGNSQPNFAGVGKPYNAADILASVNAISGSLTNQSDLMAKDRKAQQMSEANAYVSGLLGKGDRASILAAQSMLPYANERYGKQADNIMADIRQAEQMKQAREISDIDQAMKASEMTLRDQQFYANLNQQLKLQQMEDASKIKAAQIAASSGGGKGDGLTARDLVNIDKYNSEPVDIVWKNAKGKQNHSVVSRFQANNMLNYLNTGKPVKDADGKMVTYKDLKNIISMVDSNRYKSNELTPYQAAMLKNKDRDFRYREDKDNSYWP